ncbi:MAG: hypothetical protein Tsb002_37230 [Wenzhouxiangellaceae bacterium]
MKRHSLMLLLVLLAGFTLAACNTIEGAGKDIKSAGRAIEEAADDDDI